MISKLPFPGLPEGKVTFLFTDIEGSTQFLAQLRDQNADLLANQRRILRETFTSYNGREVDTQGDAFFIAFPRATEAVATAVEIQRALTEYKWPEDVEVRVRMGLHTGEPWLHTGDIAEMDEDGYFKIVDRKKDLILGAGGFNIYPREIEDVLYEHPKVLEAAAVGVPVEDQGERVKVFIVLKEGQTATEEQMIAFCQENLAPFKVPKFVEFRSDLPKTLVGKILRRELAGEEADGC